MKKLFSLLLLSLLFCNTTFGQELKYRFVFSYGYGFHYSQSPNDTYIYMTGNHFPDPPGEKFVSESWWSFSPFDYCFDFRLNIVEPNKNMAISVKATPTLGFDWAKCGMFSVQLPVLLEFDKGAGSTYEATDENGFYVNAGINFMVNPILGVMNIEESAIEIYGGKLDKTWLRPTFGIGYRYWSNLNRMKEVGLQFAIGPKGDAIPDLPSYDDATYSTTTAFYIGLTVKRFFNY